MASGLIYDDDGNDITMDYLSDEVEKMPDPRQCEFVIFSGSPNPDSANFGPPEFCEEYAEPGESYCSAHLPFTED